MKRIIAVGIAIAAPILLAAGPASATVASRNRQIASCRAEGQFAICDAAGNARHHPITIVVHVRATPRQSVSVAWDITCTKGLSAGSTSGHFSSGTPINRVLRHPYKHPDSCIVSADGQLSRAVDGHLHLWLTYRGGR